MEQAIWNGEEPKQITEDMFKMYFGKIQDRAYNNSHDKGFHDILSRLKTALADGHITPADHDEWMTIFIIKQLGLVNEEVGEAMSAVRTGSMDDKLTHLPGVLVESADAVIRLMDLMGLMGHDLGDAIIQKMNYNKNRPHMHGKKA